MSIVGILFQPDLLDTGVAPHVMVNISGDDAALMNMVVAKEATVHC